MKTLSGLGEEWKMRILRFPSKHFLLDGCMQESYRILVLWIFTFVSTYPLCKYIYMYIYILHICIDVYRYLHIYSYTCRL